MSHFDTCLRVPKIDNRSFEATCSKSDTLQDLFAKQSGQPSLKEEVHAVTKVSVILVLTLGEILPQRVRMYRLYQLIWLLMIQPGQTGSLG